MFDSRGFDYGTNVYHEATIYSHLLRFYYVYSDFTTNDKLVIEIEVDNRYYKIMLYVAIILLTIVGLVILYLIIVLIRYCFCRGGVRVVDSFQLDVWRSQADQRYTRIINGCPAGTYDQKITKFDEVSCIICLAIYQDGNNIRTLPCQHVFHTECIEQWIKAKIATLPRCPTCNVPLTDERPPGYVE